MSDVIGASGESGSSEVEVLRRRLSRVERLYEVGNIMHSTLDPNRALELIVEQSVRLTRATSGSVVLINPTTGYLEILAAAGLPGEGRRLRLRVGQGITGWVAQTGKAAVVRDVSSDNRYVQVYGPSWPCRY
jgi:Nif-specific regulatory protein